jgi:uridine kinase
LNKDEIIKIHGKIIKSYYDLQVVNYEARKNPELLVNTSERIFHDQINELVKIIIKGKYKVIYIAGPSSAGKTTSSKLISDALKRKKIVSTVISTDDFFIDRDKTPLLPDGNFDYDNITALDAGYYKEFMSELVDKGKSKMPIFDFYQGKRTGYKEIQSNKNDIIMIEGTHAMNPIFSNEVNTKGFKVYVTLNDDFVLGREVIIPSRVLRLMRRCIRDYYKRGNSVDDTIKIWKNVCKGENEFISPFKIDADYILNTTHMYEPLIYDFYLKPLLINAEDNIYTQDFKNIFSKTGSLKKDLIPEDSMLWEFMVKDN